MHLPLYFDWVAADTASAAKGFRQTEWVVDLLYIEGMLKNMA